MTGGNDTVNTLRSSRFSTCWDLSRPFTLLPPVIGMLSGALCGLGALATRSDLPLAELLADRGPQILRAVVLGAIMAGALNAASNVLNQVTDLVNDRVNKPHRPLPSGRISPRGALALSVVLYGLALGAGWAVGTTSTGIHECFWIAVGGAVASVVYSVRPMRTKRRAWSAAVTIGVSRGLLLRACGWSCVATVFVDPEPWFTAMAFFFFVLGASATKDFADVEGDRQAGCHTLPVIHGATLAARRVAPFLVFPWLLLPVGLVLEHPLGGSLLAVSANTLLPLTALLVVYGAYVARTLLRDPEGLLARENHPSWAHMYGLMMLAQGGLALAYLL